MNLYPMNLMAYASILTGRGGWVTYCRFGGGKEREEENEKRAARMSRDVIGCRWEGHVNDHLRSVGC